MINNKRMVVIAPQYLFESLRDGFSKINTELKLIPLPKPIGSKKDPYGIENLTQTLSLRPDGILLVAPKRRSPTRLIPAPVLHSVPIGILLAESKTELEPWLNALTATNFKKKTKFWVVLAMWRDLYLNWGKKFTQWMYQGVSNEEISIQEWFANKVSRDDLCKRLTICPELVIYIGHGRARGWSGFRGVRWNHISENKMKKPCGVLISFACNTLKRTRGVFPFGCMWINEGRACSYFGSIASINYNLNAALAREIGQMFARGHCQTIGQLLQEIYELCRKKPSLENANRALQNYRLIGNPLQPFY